jgi:hypothetical protein
MLPGSGGEVPPPERLLLVPNTIRERLEPLVLLVADVGDLVWTVAKVVRFQPDSREG